ncbi:MAG TPA: RHS repeat-associated core domain-containing protein, partial [Thermoanaerobaculia bacterium]|nr:RHS repeat-associated core domain-containing protein [Thermoanaerobaculia bacterium]
RATRQAYDAAGNLSRLTNRRGQVVAFGYDAANRMVHRDADGQRTTWTYHPDHRTVTVSNPESTDEFTVDAAGRPDLARVRRGSISLTRDETLNRRGQRELLTLTGPWNTRTLGYGYDAQGEFQTLRDFNGETTRLVRNADGVVTHTYYPRFGIIHESGALHTVYAQHFTGLTASSPNPGVGYNFDPLGRMAERYPAATATRFWKYRYDPVGRLKAAEEWDRSPDVCTSDPDRGVVCEPDPAYSPAPRPRRTHGYSYDVLGNPSGVDAEIKPGNRLTKYKGFVMEYDEDGNLKMRYTPDWWTFNQTLTWNSLGQLTGVNGISYGYDGLGRRVRRTIGGTTRHYVYDGDDLIMELGSDGSVEREYVHFPGTDEPHSIRMWAYGMNGATHYYVTQRPGSVTAMVDVFGNVVREFRYDPYGNPEPGFENDDSQNPLRFASREWDVSSGLYYLRNRWYSPTLERFISEDPIGLGGGINTYSYAADDPINFHDPFGTTYQVSDECSVTDAQDGKCALGLPGLTVVGRSSNLARILRHLLDIGVGFVPVAASVHDFATLTTGKNHITGEEVGAAGRVAAGAGLLLPISGAHVSKLFKVKHHVFPQAPELQAKFLALGINVHSHIIKLDIPTHMRIHLGRNGGPWLDDWREFLSRPGIDAASTYAYGMHMLNKYQLSGEMTGYGKWAGW